MLCLPSIEAVDLERLIAAGYVAATDSTAETLGEPQALESDRPAMD